MLIDAGLNMIRFSTVSHGKFELIQKWDVETYNYRHYSKLDINQNLFVLISDGFNALMIILIYVQIYKNHR